MFYGLSSLTAGTGLTNVGDAAKVESPLAVL
jgi:hypothetical protein